MAIVLTSSGYATAVTEGETFDIDYLIKQFNTYRNPRVLLMLGFKKMLYDNSRKMVILFLLPPPSAPWQKW